MVSNEWWVILQSCHIPGAEQSGGPGYQEAQVGAYRLFFCSEVTLVCSGGIA